MAHFTADWSLDAVAPSGAVELWTVVADTDWKSFEIKLSSAILGDLTLQSSVDFEDALQKLRAMLEERGWQLLCNRYRVDATMSGMARSMSHGLRCYVVELGVSKPMVVDSLGPTEPGTVGTVEENDAHIARWRTSF